MKCKNKSVHFSNKFKKLYNGLCKDCYADTLTKKSKIIFYSKKLITLDNQCQCGSLHGVLTVDNSVYCTDCSKLIKQDNTLELKIDQLNKLIVY